MTAVTAGGGVSHPVGIMVEYNWELQSVRERAHWGSDDMAITTNNTSAEELERRRAEILNELGLTLDELTARRRSGSMTAEEWAAWEELDGIEYLIG